MAKPFKVVSVFVALFVLLGAFATPAFAGDGATNMVLANAHYAPGKGPVFEFKVNGVVGGIGKSSFVASSATFNNVYCVQVDADTVKCTFPKKSAGLSGALNVGDFGFWIDVPEERPFCYGVHDYVPDGWWEFATYCQADKAYMGETIIHPDPMGFSWVYGFKLNGVPGYDQGPAYYAY